MKDRDNTTAPSLLYTIPTFQSTLIDLHRTKFPSVIMYGDASLKLVQHAKRTQTLPHLPPYQADLVRSITREVRALDASVQSTISTLTSGGTTPFDPDTHPGPAAKILTEYVVMRRNKRCLLAYHRVRAQRVDESVWKGVDLLEANAEGGAEENAGKGVSSGDGNVEGALSPEEEEYARAYGELVAAYKGRWTDVDLTGALEPPRDLFVDVRVLRDAGEIQTEYGAINLTKNSQFYVRQADVERLIAQGYLQKLS
ncbi:DNA replication complex GINS protein PSF1 [Microthyrium microscopicum]|uniref:DNA replication complex GINS protein PSF1 n=1 Tax=Microthyrium microscopicum TaxID=703497 RepID=A0A6A6U5Q8_9PEZI|nr:DNA replication complex GINS protein PSF1 [Microthyrium microscopicum]